MNQPLLMTVTAYEKAGWSRLATAAYASNRNPVGHRYSTAASMPEGSRMTCQDYDRLMDGWRGWMVFSRWPVIAD